jgi:PAN domain
MIVVCFLGGRACAISGSMHAIRGIVVSAVLALAAPALAGESDFVFVPRADITGNDLLKVDNTTFEDCAKTCDARRDCNAFTYNQIDSSCFLKYAANRTTDFYVTASSGIRLAPSMMPTAAASASGRPSFVLLSQTDTPGNDYSRTEDSSFEDCRKSCETEERCAAFTYNHARGVCFLKRAVNQWTSFSTWAGTGIKLSPAEPKEPAITTEPAQPEVAEPPDAQP